MSKRTYEEVDVGDIKDASSELQIRGMLGDVSPMKKGKSASYIHGEMTDGKGKVRLYGFDDNNRKRLSEASGSSVILANCKVKKARYSDEYEVLVNRNTIVEKSDRTFNIPPEECDGSRGKITLLKCLSDMSPFTKVTCQAKVLQLEEPTETATGKILQNVLIADSSGTAKLTLWEADINKLEVNKSYELGKMVLREFRGQIQLSCGKDESTITGIDDLEGVQQDESSLLSDVIEKATVLGVLSLESYSTCLKCNGKITNADEEFGTCSKCGMLQLLGACKEEMAAQLMIKGGSSGNILLKAYGKVLHQITGGEVTSYRLLSAGSFTALHQDGVIRSVKVIKTD